MTAFVRHIPSMDAANSASVVEMLAVCCLSEIQPMGAPPHVRITRVWLLSVPGEKLASAKTSMAFSSTLTALSPGKEPSGGAYLSAYWRVCRRYLRTPKRTSAF